VAAPKLSAWGGKAGPRGSARAHLSREVRSKVEEYVAAPELTLTRRQGPELRNTWQHRSSTQQGGVARDHGPHGSTGAHLSKEVKSGVVGHVAALEPTSVGRCDPKLQLAW
jgi:hypothetical protein